MRRFEYHIDLDERGSFRAHVENKKTGKVVFEFSNEIACIDDNGNLTGETYDGELWIVEAGFMKHTEDLDGLEEYLVDMKIINDNDYLIPHVF